MHRPIRRFEQSGEIYDDRYFARLKSEYIALTVLEMRYQGYVPRFDIDPDWSLSYNGKSYYFRLSVYGVYVGKRKAEWIQGMDGNKPIHFTQKNRSDTRSEQAVSE